MLPTMEQKTVLGGNTETELLARIELKLYTHAEWAVSAIERGEVVPGPVGGAEFTLERHEAFLAESQVLHEAIRLLLGYLSTSAHSEGVEAARAKLGHD
jgi:hypothetical protein